MRRSAYAYRESKKDYVSENMAQNAETAGKMCIIPQSWDPAKECHKNTKRNDENKDDDAGQGTHDCALLQVSLSLRVGNPFATSTQRSSKLKTETWLVRC